MPTNLVTYTQVSSNNAAVTTDVKCFWNFINYNLSTGSVGTYTQSITGTVGTE